jgi:hypothetical protein
LASPHNITLIDIHCANPSSDFSGEGNHKLGFNGADALNHRVKLANANLGGRHLDRPQPKPQGRHDQPG